MPARSRRTRGTAKWHARPCHGPDAHSPASSEAKYIDWLTIDDREQSVVEDVSRIRAHPLVPGGIPIYGFVYDVKSGRLIEVPDATKAGRPR